MILPGRGSKRGFRQRDGSAKKGSWPITEMGFGYQLPPTHARKGPSFPRGNEAHWQWPRGSPTVFHAKTRAERESRTPAR
jgi:hypothetical protein